MEYSNQPDPPDSEILYHSGCQDIQDALSMGAQYGFTAADLDAENIYSVIGVMASADSVDAQAAPK